MFGGKMGNMLGAIKNAKKMQEMMKQAQEELDHLTVTANSGVDMVVVTMSARHKIISLTLSDDLLKESKETVEELIKSAMNSAHQKAEQASQEKMAEAAQFLNLDGLMNEDDAQ